MSPWKISTKIPDACRNLTRRFLDAPFSATLWVLGVILLLEVILSGLSDLAGISTRFSMDLFGWVVSLIVASVLLSGHVTRFIIGLFLLFVFLFSIGFLIFPIDQVATVVRTSLGVDETAITKIDGKFRTVDSDLFYAEFQLEKPEGKGAAISKDSERVLNTLKRSRDGLKSLRDDVLQIIEPVAPTNSGLSTWVRPVLENVERVLRIGAPFIFSMLMGALGSSIIITKQFITYYEGQKPAWYLYRLIQGMTIALLMVYGLAAGILSLGGKQQPIDATNFEQNKFFIGFISALAGLFSEQAYAKLQDLSRTLFGLVKQGETGGHDETSAMGHARSKPPDKKE